MKEQLRKYVRYPALVEAGLVSNRVTLGRWIKSGRFPKPVRLGPNIVAWRLEEIEKYLADLEQARDQPKQKRPLSRPTERAKSRGDQEA